MHEHRSESSSHVDVHAGYERRDVKIALILWTFVTIAILSVISFVGMRALERGFERTPHMTSTGERPSVALEDDAFVHPAVGPKLQTDPVQDMVEWRAIDLKARDSYGWADQGAGIARIPVDEAIKRIAQSGMPVWKAPDVEVDSEAADAP